MFICKKCGGKIMVDRAYSSNGHIELFCIICGFRKEYHKDTEEAQYITRLEKRRELGMYAKNLFLGQQSS